MKDLKDTIAMMTSDDYKERFKAEYWQTKIRYFKLKDMIIKYEEGALHFQPTCPINLLNMQATAMHLYLETLMSRAEIEGIDLEGELWTS